jgi:hypothetical protein
VSHKHGISPQSLSVQVVAQQLKNCISLGTLSFFCCTAVLQPAHYTARPAALIHHNSFKNNWKGTALTRLHINVNPACLCHCRLALALLIPSFVIITATLAKHEGSSSSAGALPSGTDTHGGG